MKQNRNAGIILLIMITLVFFLSGCVSNPFIKPTTQDDFRIGRDGILINFLDNAPPSETYEEYPFSIGLMLKNAGAYDTKGGIISFTVEDDYIELLNNKDIRFNLKGKSIALPTGDQKTEVIRAKAKKISGQSEMHTSKILASICYPYQTKKNIDVCIDTDIYNIKNMKKVCNVKDITLTTQGAPVAITKIESEMLSSEDEKIVKPSFKIYIKNVGGGIVFAKEKVNDACSSAPLKYEELNAVEIKVMMSGEELQCREKILKLKENKDNVICTFESGVSTEKAIYTTPLTIELNYGYSTSISKDILIKKE